MPMQRRFRSNAVVGIAFVTYLGVAFDILQSILKTPRYGRYVRHIELNRSPSMDIGFVKVYKMKNPQRSLEAKDLERLKTAIRRCCFDSPEERAKMLNILLQSPASMGYHDRRAPFLAQALAALLVSVSPQLESLDLCPVSREPSQLAQQTAQVGDSTLFRKTDYFFKHFLDRANSSNQQETMPFLQNLREVRFLVDVDIKSQYEYYYQPYDLYGSLNLVRRLPAVESIRVDAIMTPKESSDQPPAGSANYTRIIIRNSSLDYPYLVGAIESAKQLEEFTYAIGGRGARHGLLGMFSPNHVLRALLLHRDSLVHLDLDVEAETLLHHIFDPTLRQQFPFSDDEYERSVGFHNVYHGWGDRLEELTAVDGSLASWSGSSSCSLRGFTKLKNLSLGIHLLYYLARGIGPDQVEDESFAIVDHLPPNLESLSIYGYEEGMRGLRPFHRQLEQLLAEKDKKLPRLVYIEGIDELIENAATVRRPDLNRHLLWEGETDCEWTDHEDYD
ncbi:hypothetical protein FE257_005385 [Aspergillus nanangensis]|uniref:Uncharacterized protein n=1 Tax=Aspergillus nanangensis TaxID=2582783 RepID=A0AAD4CQH7_ASPNN|nr:hypothetical protein FE257_005385 [Aspergillus nanangensis]